MKTRKIICDIETDSLENCKHIWVCSCKEYGTDKVIAFREGDREKAKEYIESFDKIIGHNFIEFDSYWLNKLWNIDIPISKIEDTLVMSRLADSSRKSHSLKFLSQGTEEEKTHHEDWSQWSDEMEEYCKQDVRATEVVYNNLVKELQDFSSESIYIEHMSQYILANQRRVGFKLDIDRALFIKNKIENEYMEILSSLENILKPRKILVKEYKARKKANGDLTLKSKEIISRPYVEHVEGDLYNIYEYKPFNIDSPSEIVERLKDYWDPYEFTKNGQPQVNENNLNTLKENAPEELKLIKKCKTLKSRATLIESFIKAMGEDGRVHGSVMSIGTVTHRMAHNNPNTGNIPRKGLYGAVCRELFIVDKGRKLVGCDASGIQLRALAHYLNDQSLIHQIESGDVHWYLSGVYGLHRPDEVYDEHNPAMKKARDTAKTITYSILMGGGVTKIGSIAGGDFNKGKKIFNSLSRRLKTWDKLKRRLAKSADRGYLISIGGRKIPVKSAHFGMSVLLQSFEQDIMKWAMIQSYKRLKGIDSYQVAIVHDEFQRDTAEDQAEYVGKVMRQCIIDAGEHYKVNLKLDGEYKIGNNWGETH